MATVPTCVTRLTWSATAETFASIKTIEETVGGRVGVYALDTATGQTIEHRPDERFAMCSTFKWLLAAQFLAGVDRGTCSLQETLAFGTDDLLEHAPVTSKYVEKGRLSLDQLARAAVTVSDNTAANLLLKRLGGPKALTAFARSLGDAVTRLDRIEPGLNSNAANDVRDTTTPRGMVTSMESALAGDALSAESRDRLIGWLVESQTGRDRLRAGMLKSWTVGDKTGSGKNNAVNDVAIAFPPRRRPILVASYMSESTSSLQALNAAHASVAKLVGVVFGPVNND